jgi:hypothetical protein
MQIDNKFAVVFLTALDKDKSIARSKSLLVTAVARAHNTGMRLNAERNQLEEVGTAPILMEPVKASFILKRKSLATVMCSITMDGVQAKRYLLTTESFPSMARSRRRCIMK